MSEYIKELNAAALALERAKIVVTVSHRRPDGDTIGSACALAEALETAGKTVRCFCVDAIPSSIASFTGSRRFTPDPSVFVGADTVVVLDSGDLRFVGIDSIVPGLSRKPVLINIDHHAINDKFGDINFVVTEAASTTEAVFAVIKTMRYPVTPQMATQILMGIVTDTMMFFNPATTASSLQVAAELERLGGDIKKVSRLVSKNRNIESLVLWGKALERLKWDKARSRVSTAILADELAGLPAGDDAMDGLSNFLNNNLSAQTIMVLRELGGGMVKGSLRTASDEVDVCEEAVKYGGGGHRKAAGFAVRGKIVEGENEWKVDISS
jgi:bifunctional oligoribonuclease and PAP phosphatase NrnA